METWRRWYRKQENKFTSNEIPRGYRVAQQKTCIPFSQAVGPHKEKAQRQRSGHMRPQSFDPRPTTEVSGFINPA